jgi:hypothetical protein
MADEKKLGKTGNFPQGKIAPDDEGELRMAIGHNANRKVMVNFGTPVVWFLMDPEGAREMARALLQHADQAEKNYVATVPTDPA